jgi:protein TonB
MIALGVVLVLAGVGIIWLIRNVLSQAPAPAKQVVQEIRVIRPPPPPEVKPPPPPPPEEKVDVPEPDPEPEPAPSDEPPPSNQLGIDAEGTGAGDGFGLVGNKGGRDLLASGGSAYAWYGGLIKTEILDCLQNDDRIRSGSYSVPVRVWVRPDGTIERVGVVQSTGDRARDRAIEMQISKCSRFSQAPPADMPQPITVRVASRA